jgi:hypothetical protein
LAISGDAAREAEATEAGANGFILKPFSSVGAFQQAILAHLPSELQPPGPRMIPDDQVIPDPVAFQDDIAHMAAVLQDHPDGSALDYIAQFTRGIAKIARDKPLESAARSLATDRANGRAGRSGAQRLDSMLRERLVNRRVV